MKKNKLLVPVSYDFLLIGIVSGVKDYKLAWELNRTKKFHFIRQENIHIEFKDHSIISIGNFLCESDFHQYNLLKNRLEHSNDPAVKFVLNELQQFDYLLKIENLLDDFDLDSLISSVRNINSIDYLVKLDTKNLKNKENLLF